MELGGGDNSLRRAKAAYSGTAWIALGGVIASQVLAAAAALLVTRKGASSGGETELDLFLMQLPMPLVLIGLSLLFGPKEKAESCAGETGTGFSFPALLLAALPLMYGGALLGNLAGGLLSMGRGINPVQTVTGRSGPLMLLYMVVIGPVTEEWFFRGTLLPRVARFGEKTAIWFTALLFALYHVNVYQFFYAFWLGLMLGYIRVRTGGIRLGALLHMTVNVLGGALPALVIRSGSENVLAAFALSVLLLAAAGIAVLRRFLGARYYLPAEEELPDEIGRQCAVNNAGMIICTLVCLALAAYSLYA